MGVLLKMLKLQYIMQFALEVNECTSEMNVPPTTENSIATLLLAKFNSGLRHTTFQWTKKN